MHVACVQRDTAVARGQMDCQFDSWDACFATLQDQLGSEMRACVSSAASQQLAEAQAQRSAGRDGWWRLREAALHALGTLVPSDETDVPDGLNVRPVLDNILQNDLAAAQLPPLLQGRALWVAAKLAQGLPQQQAVQLLPHAVAGLGGAHAMPVRICACRAAAQLFRLCDAEASAQHVKPAVAALMELMQSVDPDVLLIVLEATEVRLLAALCSGQSLSKCTGMRNFTLPSCCNNVVAPYHLGITT